MGFIENRRLLVIVGLFVASQAVNAATALAAVAANFTKPMTEIAEAFEKSTGHTAKLSLPVGEICRAIRKRRTVRSVLVGGR